MAPQAPITPQPASISSPDAPGIVRNEHGTIEGCSVIHLSQFQRSYTMPFTITDDASRARSAVLRINGTATNGTLPVTIDTATL